MGDMVEWWLAGGDWYDLQQRRELQSLSQSHARTSSRLREQLRQESRRGEDLATRLDKVERALVAVVELEDLRAVLENSSDAVATRRYARDVLAQIPALRRVSSSGTPVAPPDVPDYWLHPAVRAVDARLRGGGSEVELAQEARRRDPVRTGQFLAAVAILIGSSASADDLQALWPAERDISPYQRSLWTAVADGGLGPDARDALVTALRGAVAAVATDEQPPPSGFAGIATSRRVAPTARRSGAGAVEQVVLRGLLDVPALPDDPAVAARMLGRMRAAVGSAAQVRADGGPDGVPGGVADLLAQVVSAGAPQEEPLVERIVEIRGALAEIGATTAIATPAMLDTGADDLLDLLRADLGEEAPATRRAVAQLVLRDALATVADRLAEVARQPAEDRADVRLPGGRSVRVSSDGPVDPGWRDGLVPHGRGPMAQTAARHRARALLMLVPAALAVLLGVLASPWWLLLLVPVAGVAVFSVLAWRRAAQDDRADVERRRREAEEAVATRVREHARTMQEVWSEQQAAAEHVTALRQALGAA